MGDPELLVLEGLAMAMGIFWNESSTWAGGRRRLFILPPHTWPLAPKSDRCCPLNPDNPVCWDRIIRPEILAPDYPDRIFAIVRAKYCVSASFFENQLWADRIIRPGYFQISGPGTDWLHLCCRPENWEAGLSGPDISKYPGQVLSVALCL